MDKIKEMTIEKLYCYYKLCITMKSKCNKSIKPIEFNKFITIENILLEEINNRLNSLLNV